MADIDSKRRLAAWLLALVVGGGLCLAAFKLAGPSLPFPPCLVHELTGFHCPGCGLGRGMRCLADLDFAGALRENLLVFGLTPPLLAFLFIQGATGRPALSPRAFQAILLGYLLLALLFAVLRNLPFEPFSSLAPV